MKPGESGAGVEQLTLTENPGRSLNWLLVYSKLLYLIIGVLLHLGFILATFQLKRSFQWVVAIYVNSNDSF